ncbi:DUF1697 domain-containing protein [Streptomyces sp. NPDC005438]|uniref:DUF1697 domain-containing protein n=1 Tax=Streptomyces sp. NPDC005438 TaxID=3156880 RepID=UPI0033BF91E4
MARTHVALLRAVNVGGRNRVPMAELRELCAEELGYTGVRTHLQSGNAVFDSDREPARIAEELERALADRFQVSTRVLLRGAGELEELLTAHPYAAEEPDEAKLMVAFLERAPEEDRVRALTVPPGEEARCTVRGREVFVHYPHGAGRSRLDNALLERRLGVASTARNLRTVRALREMAG